MYDDRPDEPIPPLDRPGVAPLWRLVAILGLIGLALLLSMVVVFFMALVQQGARNANNAWAANPAMPVVAGAAGGGDAAEDVLDPANPAYPLKQDLRPAGSFPLPGDAEPNPGDPALSPRQEFRKLADHVAWDSSDPDLPERVLVSPDGANMAYTIDDLMVGPLGAPVPVGQDVLVPPGGRMRGGMMFGAAGLPPQPHVANGRRAALSGWSADGVVVSWVGVNGRPSQHDVQTKNTTHLEFNADALLPLPGGDGRLAVVTRESRPKLDGAGDRADRDLSAVKILPGDDRHPTVLVRPEASRWESPALSPDGKRLAVVSDRGEKPGRRRLFLLSLDGNGPKAEPVSPPADRFEGVCWTSDGKELVYARSQFPAPADHAPGTPKDACDLYLLDVETRKEMRLSRGGGFTSPSVTKDGNLFLLQKVQPAGAAPSVQLLQMTLQEARKWAEGKEKEARDRAKQWKELADSVLKQTGVPAKLGQGDVLRLKSPKRTAAAFARAYAEKFNADPPVTADALEGQRREVAGLDLTPDEQARFALLLGAVEGEYLCGRQKDSDWHAKKELGSSGAVTAENPFGYAYNPFRPLRRPEKADKEESPQSLAELLYRAEGRPIVLSDDADSAKEALDNLIDPDRARGSALLAQDKGDEADRVLLEMTKRHAGNQYLTVEVGTLLQRRGRGTALGQLLKPLLDQLDAGGLALSRDARLYNLLGVAALDNDTRRAITAFQDALRCDLNYGPAYLNLAQAYQKASRTSDARLCLRRYLKLFPEGEWADDARRRLAVAGDE